MSRTDGLLLASVLASGVWLRLDGVGAMALFGDEYHGSGVGEQSLAALLTSFDTVGSHVATPVLQHLALQLFGGGVLAFRLIALVPGLLTLFLAYPLLRTLLSRGEGEVGRAASAAALAATALIAVNPMLVYYARYGRAYAMVVLLGLLLAVATVAALRAAPGSRGARLAWGAALASATLLPVFHLSSAGLVAALGGAALLVAGRERAPAVLAVFGGAAVLAFLCFVPVLGDVQAYFAQTRDVKDQPSSALAMLALLGGGAPGAVLLALGLGPGLVALRTRFGRTDTLLVAGAGLLGPLVALLALRPHGMEYAWSRYLLNAVPFVALAVGAALAWGCGRLGRPGLASWLGVGLAAALLATGPLLQRGPRTPVFDNSYLALRPLPAFDVPWPGASPFYGTLAAEEGPLRIVEAPPPITRAVLVLRNHALVHGHEVVLGWPGGLPLAMKGDAPYVPVLAATAADADYVVLHRNLAREVDRYFRFVHEEAWPTVEAALDAGPMLRHRAHFAHTQPHLSEEFVADLAARLRERHGPATYKDEQVLVWRLGD